MTEIELLKRIKDLLEVLVKDNISKKLSKELNNPKKKMLYELTGKANRDEIIKGTGFSAGKVSKMWQEWEAIGMLKKEGQTYKKVI